MPALPPSWGTGAISGLRARGGFEVAMEWKNGKLQGATLRNAKPTTCKVRYGNKVVEIAIKAGQPMRLNGDLAEAK